MKATAAAKLQLPTVGGCVVTGTGRVRLRSLATNQQEVSSEGAAAWAHRHAVQQCRLLGPLSARMLRPAHPPMMIFMLWMRRTPLAICGVGAEVQVIRIQT